MACDMFSLEEANKLLRGNYIHFFGDSNIRAIYKDLLWLLEDGRIIPDSRLKTKNEESHANDFRISNGSSHNGCDYEERREYNRNVTVKFDFMTRLYRGGFINAIRNFRKDPHILVLHSCLWDVTRWGTNGVEQYKNNLQETFEFLRTTLPKTRIIWISSLPPSFKSRGGFLTKEIEFMRKMLPWHMLCANHFAHELADFFSVDFLDLHYHFRFLQNYHTPDGIHWNPLSVRFATNLLLTHVSLVWGKQLPNIFPLDERFLSKQKLTVVERVEKNDTALRNISNISRGNNKQPDGIKKTNFKKKQRKPQNVRLPAGAIDRNQYRFTKYKKNR